MVYWPKRGKEGVLFYDNHGVAGHRIETIQTKRARATIIVGCNTIAKLK